MHKKIIFLLTVLVFSISSEAGTKTQLAITVDDLPTHGQLPKNTSRIEIAQKMISIFKKHGIKEVYGFINAKKIEQEPNGIEVLNTWIKAGYPLGNHTYSHLSLEKITTDEFTADIKQNESTLQKLSGKFDWHYFRYPFLHEGDTPAKRETVRNFLQKEKYRIAQVTLDFDDWSWNEPYARCSDTHQTKKIDELKKSYLQYADHQFKQAMILSDALYHHPVKHILLLHIGGFDPIILDEYLLSLEKKGVEYISLKEALEDPIYQENPKLDGKTRNEFIYQIMHSRGLKSKDIGLSTKNTYPEKVLNTLCKE